MPTLPFARQWRVLLLGPGEELAQSLRALLQAGAPTAQIFNVRIYPEPAAVPKLLGPQPPSVCFLDATTQPEVAFALIRELQRAAPHMAVVAILSGEDPDRILRCLRQGAVDFLTPPIDAEQLNRVCQRVLNAYPELMPAGDQGQLLAVMPVNGGCGASTLALNLSYQRKGLGADRVLLADLDPLTGIQAFQLKIKPVYTFLDALDRGAALDSHLWRSLVRHQGGVDLLASPEVIVEALYQLPDPAPLLEFARSIYDCVVVDAASVYGDWNLRIAQQADELLLIAMGDVFTLRKADRALRYLRRQQIPESRIKLILNRVERDGTMSASVIETALQIPVFASLPTDSDAIQSALLKGKPVASGTPLARAIGRLASRLSGQPASSPQSESTPGPKVSALNVLLSLFGRKATP